MKNGGGKCLWRPHTHERTLAPTLPQAVEHSIVATSTHTHTHASKQASKCERINSKPRTFSAYSNFCSSYKLNCFVHSWIDCNCTLFTKRKKSIKDIFTRKKRPRAYTLSKIFNTNLLFSFSETSTIVYCIKILVVQQTTLHWYS